MKREIESGKISSVRQFVLTYNSFADDIREELENWGIPETLINIPRLETDIDKITEYTKIYSENITKWILQQLYLIKELASREELKSVEIECIKLFIQEKTEESPVIRDFFSKHTKGDFLTETFDINNEEIKKNISSIIKQRPQEGIAVQPEQPDSPNTAKYSSSPDEHKAENDWETWLQETWQKAMENEENDKYKWKTYEKCKELALLVFKKAIEEGDMRYDNKKLIWTKDQASLSYILGRVFCGDTSELKDKKYYWNKGNQKFPTKLLNQMIRHDDNGELKDMKGAGAYRRKQIVRSFPTSPGSECCKKYAVLINESLKKSNNNNK